MGRKTSLTGVVAVAAWQLALIRLVTNQHTPAVVAVAAGSDNLRDSFAASLSNNGSEEGSLC